MNYFYEIKPTLNKLSKFNVFDSLDVVSLYVRDTINGSDISNIKKVEHPKYSSIEIFFADFLIENIIKYCTIAPSNHTL